MATEAGLKGMLYLRENIPGVGAGETNQMIFYAGTAEGYKIALNKISDVLTLRDEAPEDLEPKSLEI